VAGLGPPPPPPTPQPPIPNPQSPIPNPHIIKIKYFNYKFNLNNKLKFNMKYISYNIISKIV
jgi:hypothetical protein